MVTAQTVEEHGGEHEGGVLQELPRGRHYASAHEGMETGTVVPDARYGLGPCSLLCLDSTGEEKGEAQHGENCSHEGPQKKECDSLRVSSPGHDPAGSGEEP